MLRHIGRDSTHRFVTNHSQPHTDALTRYPPREERVLRRGLWYFPLYWVHPSGSIPHDFTGPGSRDGARYFCGTSVIRSKLSYLRHHCLAAGTPLGCSTVLGATTVRSFTYTDRMYHVVGARSTIQSMVRTWNDGSRKSEQCVLVNAAQQQVW